MIIKLTFLFGRDVLVIWAIPDWKDLNVVVDDLTDDGQVGGNFWVALGDGCDDDVILKQGVHCPIKQDKISRMSQANDV